MIWLFVVIPLGLAFMLACAETGGPRRPPPPRRAGPPSTPRQTARWLLTVAGLYLAGLFAVGYALHLAGF